jgi:hypothetical protein
MVAPSELNNRCQTIRLDEQRFVAMQVPCHLQRLPVGPANSELGAIAARET